MSGEAFSSSVRPAGRTFGRAAHWTVGLVAAVLVLISVGGYFKHRGQLLNLAAEHLRLVVTGPSSVRQGIAAEFWVRTTDIGGQPLPAQIEATLLGPDGQRLMAFKESADPRGRLQIVVPADIQLPSRMALRIVARFEKCREEAHLPLLVETPLTDKTNRLKTTEPKDAPDRPTLPKPSAEPGIALALGDGVFDAGKPVEFKLRTLRADRPLVAAAYCRGVLAGLFPLVTRSGVNSVSIALDPAADGTIQLVVFDYAESPPKPIAQCWVFRRPDRQQTKPDVAAETASELQPDAQPAFDALVAPPLMFDNLARLRGDYQKSLAEYLAGRTRTLNALNVASFLGGLGLVVLVAMLGLMQIVSGLHLWAAAVGSATCCLILGAILMDPGLRNADINSVAAFVSYHSPKATLDKP